jgi:hypothetical protein
MDHRGRRLASAKTMLAAALLLPPAAYGEAATIAAHRAVYDLDAIRISGGSQIASVKGRLVLEVQGSVCEGWTVNFRMVSRYFRNAGDPRLIDTQSSAYESGDALAMQYSSREFVDSELKSESRVKVKRATSEGAASGTLSGEGVNSFAVPAGTFFPIQHQHMLMARAERGEERDASLIFDGSDGANTYRAITLIGRRREAGSHRQDLVGSAARILEALPSWPMTISYFPTAGTDQETPAYQVGFDLYENGIASGLELDYGEFALGGRLADLELLPADECP